MKRENWGRKLWKIGKNGKKLGKFGDLGNFGERTPEGNLSVEMCSDEFFIEYALIRGVQYVYWVMHKCIMVKAWGKNTRKVCKKEVNLPKRGGEIWKSRGKE